MQVLGSDGIQFQLNLNPIFPVPLDVISIKWECSTIPTLYFVNRGTSRKFIRTFVSLTKEETECYSLIETVGTILLMISEH